MRKHHHKSLKFHTIFSIALIVVCIVIVALKPSWVLFASCALLVIYVAGNGIIHTRKNQLTRDSLLEYSIIAAIAVLIIFGALLR